MNKPFAPDRLRPAAAAPAARKRGTGSLTRRMIGVAALWIVVLLGAGGYALDRILTAAITRNFTRGDFFVGSSAPVRIDPRLPVRLTLAEGDQVHFSIGEPIV